VTTDSAGGPTPAERLEAVVRGRVQGVGFRMFAGRVAVEHGLVGWVARARLEAFARDLAAGPQGASVDRIETTWSAATGSFDRFALRSGWHGGD